MIIEYRNTRALVIDATDAELRWLNNYLAFDDKKAQWSPAYRTGNWDGKIRLFSLITKQFPAGLIPLVKKGAARVGTTIDIVDVRNKIAPDKTADVSWLDPVREQPQALAACLAAGRGIIWVPTGGGKTEIMIALTQSIPGKWLIAVPSLDLLNQTVDRYIERTGDTSVGSIGEGTWNEGRVTVATFQTLYTRLKSKDLRAKAFLADIDGACFDESHLLPADAFASVPKAMPKAYWRFGFSGTPLDRGDARNILLIGHTGPVIFKVAAQTLIDAGVLSKPRIKFVPLLQTVPGFFWQDVYRSGVVESKARNTLLTSIALASSKPALLIVKEIDHGRTMEKHLRAAGLKTGFVWGGHSSGSRSFSSEQLARGDLDVLVVSTIYDQGVDIPELKSVIIGCGGKSAIKALQRLGRGMRVSAGKSEMELWDVQDSGNKWLESHAADRMRVYLTQGYETVIAQLTV
jgi:superfamily II DNA or RNA helicase